MDPGLLDGYDRTQTIDMLSKQTFKHAMQHTYGGVYVGEGLPPIPQQVIKRIVKGDFIEKRNYCWNCGQPPIKIARGRSKDYQYIHVESCFT